MEALGRMASAIVHDFNNVLGAIAMATELAASEKTDMRSLAARLTQIVDTAQRLNDQLLSFAKDRNEPSGTCELGEVIEGAMAMLRAAVGTRSTLSYQAAAAAAAVAIGRSQVEQLLLNLVLNSRDAIAARGMIQIAVRDAVAADDAPPQSIVLSVSDNGAGMDEATRSRVLEPYFTTKARGTGLGLSTVFAIVNRAGGAVRVESETGSRDHGEPAAAAASPRLMTPPPRAETAPSRAKEHGAAAARQPARCVSARLAGVFAAGRSRRALGAAAARAHHRGAGEQPPRGGPRCLRSPRSRLWLGSAQRALRLALTDATVRDRMHRCFAPDGACDLPALADRLRPYASAIQVRDLILADRRGAGAGDAVRGMDRQLPHALVDRDRTPRGRRGAHPAGGDRSRSARAVRRSTRRARRNARRACSCSSCRSTGSTRCCRSRAPERAARPTRSTLKGPSSRRAASSRSSMAPGCSRTRPATRRSRVALRDPGVDLTVGSRASLPRDQQPLTRMARDARRRRRRRRRDGLPRLPRRAGGGRMALAARVRHRRRHRRWTTTRRSPRSRCCIGCSAALLAILARVMRVAARRRRCSSAGCAPARCARRTSPSASASTASCASSARAAWAPCTSPTTSCCAARR